MTAGRADGDVISIVSWNPIQEDTISVIHGSEISPAGSDEVIEESMVRTELDTL